MKVVRVIKWIVFVAFILALALSAVAHGFIYTDLWKVNAAEGESFSFSSFFLTEQEDTLMQEILDELKNTEFSFSDLTHDPLGKFEAPQSKVVDELPDVEPEVIEPVDEVIEDGSESVSDFGGDSLPEATYSSSGSNEGYSVLNHCKLVIGVMKAGSKSSDTLLSHVGLKNVSVNLAFFVAMCEAFVAFILHLISKRHKTVYGVILMIIGFLFFFGLTSCGYIISNELLKNKASLESFDWAQIHSAIVIFFTFLGTLIGLPIYSCGIRQMTCKRLRKRLLRQAQAARVADLLPRVRARYARHAEACRAKLARGERLKVAFLVCDASMFSGEQVFALLSRDPRCTCEIAVAPRVTRGEAFLRDTLAKTVRTLSVRYGAAVRPLYDPETGTSAPLDADIVFSTVVYEDQTLPDYTTERLSERALVAVLYYGYGGLFISNERKTPYLPNIVLAWRYFVSNEATRVLSVERNPQLAANIVVVGYCKMDRLAEEQRRAREQSAAGRRKKVLVCPHHTLEKTPGELALATFPEHADLFLRLPEMFPEIDFVFRPHPLLFPRLATAKWWGEARTKAYREKMERFPNVEFQQGGDYFAAFADSDAMIHDCGSFIIEYLLTGKPCCYLQDRERMATFNQLTNEALDTYYWANDIAGVRQFFDRVVLGGDDEKQPLRRDFAAKYLTPPHGQSAAQNIIDAILGEKG